MISLQRGKPAILEAGQQLPRATGIKRVCTAQESDATWAIQGDEIAFSPDVHASNVKHYSEQWQEVLVRQRRARFTLADIEQRLAEVEAEARKDAIKAQLTASPI